MTDLDTWERRYSWNYPGQKQVVVDFINRLSGVARANSRVADFGCGDGSGAAILRELGFDATQIVGFDLRRSDCQLVEDQPIIVTDLNVVADQIRNGNGLSEEIAGLRGQFDICLFLT